MRPRTGVLRWGFSWHVLFDMNTSPLKKFARAARRSLIEQVSVRLDSVLAEDSPDRREHVKAVEKLQKEIAIRAREQVIERVAYTWFNRFCALRFLDVNRYLRIGVVSPAEGQTQPGILAEAKMGHIDEAMAPEPVREQVFALLRGSAPSRDPQGEAYRLLVVAVCNSLNRAMPFLFQPIDDYTELLMSRDLLSGNSILAQAREAMTAEACRDVEVIGWLYQFYISEKKDEVFAGLKKDRKITPENIPAATQLFTPHWIVRYLVENSLGRLWMQNRPGSRLAGHMDYYIPPEQEETDFLRVGTPEEIRICDPACGSGHMLTYAFDLLYAIYEEEGYEPSGIPEKILTHNLFGVEIDQRAGELAAFALTMKARARQRAFLEKGIEPNICVLENVRFAHEELDDYMEFAGRSLFPAPLQSTLRQFEESDNFGALIRPHATDVAEELQALEGKDLSGQLLLETTHKKALKALRQAHYLSSRYHAVIANPPYMGGKGMNARLAAWTRKNYARSKSDLFAAFIERGLELVPRCGCSAMVTMQSWMFLSSFQALREQLLGQGTLLSMAHLGPRAFDTIGGEVVMTTAFVLQGLSNTERQGAYLRLIDGRSEDTKAVAMRQAIRDPDCGWFYRASAADFKKIPGSPISYWLPEKIYEAYGDFDKLGDHARAAIGLVTANNDFYVRDWYEVSMAQTGFGCAARAEAKASRKKWFPYAKGGIFRKWYGNLDSVVNWENDGFLLQTTLTEDGSRIRAHNFNLDRIFRHGICWTVVTSGRQSFRLIPEGFLFDAAAGVCQAATGDDLALLGFLNSGLSDVLLVAVNPTLNLHPGYLEGLPWNPALIPDEVGTIVEACASTQRLDWDSYETSWDFSGMPLLNSDCRRSTLEGTYHKLRARWRELTREMRRLEEENNRIFIDAYGLQDELTHDVPLQEITLTCNPHYRYGGGKSEEDLEVLLRADTMRDLVSYAVGCMFGRYALEKPGLILANQGETIEDYFRQIPEPSFPVDDDNVIPMLDGEWFSDDIVERFRRFLRVTFGEEHYEENLRFVEESLNVKGRRNYNIRTYFLGELYSDHVKRYKKRPIYWLFRSPRGSFNALIYMHRYRPDTVSVVLNEYLREFRAKLEARLNELQVLSMSPVASRSEKTRALREIEKTDKVVAELTAYERDTLYPLATRQVEIDLDDGVKVNYPKLGAALKKVPGLTASLG